MSILCSLRSILPVACLGTAVLLSGCGFLGADESNKPKGMTVSADIGDIHRCSKISPEIAVVGTPDGTAYYEIRLNIIGKDQRLLGGGEWKYEGKDEDGRTVIPEGALTAHYRGPCPDGSEEEYMFSVAAMPGENGAPLEVGYYKFKLD